MGHVAADAFEGVGQGYFFCRIPVVGRRLHTQAWSLVARRTCPSQYFPVCGPHGGSLVKMSGCEPLYFNVV